MRDPTAGDEPQGRTEEELVARFQAGEAGAFDALVEIHANRLFALAAELLGSREDAEDVTQEVLVKLHRQLSSARRGIA